MLSTQLQTNVIILSICYLLAVYILSLAYFFTNIFILYCSKTHSLVKNNIIGDWCCGDTSCDTRGPCITLWHRVVADVYLFGCLLSVHVLGTIMYFGIHTIYLSVYLSIHLPMVIGFEVQLPSAICCIMNCLLS